MELLIVKVFCGFLKIISVPPFALKMSDIGSGKIWLSLDILFRRTHGHFFCSNVHVDASFLNYG